MIPRDVLAQLVLEDGRRWIEAAEDFQLADTLAVLEGDRPYQFLTRARGSSKTTDLAAVALADLLTLGSADRLYWVAADRDQGTLALDAIAGFASRSEWIGSRVDLQARKVLAPVSGASLEVLAADAAGAWGLRPRSIFADELAQWPDTAGPRRLWEALSSAVAKRKDSRLVVLTTAGDPAHFSAEVLEHAKGSPLWRVNEVAGPSPWMDERRLAEQRARLTESSYRRLFLNQWATAEDRLTDLEAVRECVSHEGALAYDPAAGYVVALDLGLKRDRTVAVVAHREGSRVVLDRIETWQGSRLRPVKIEEVEDWVRQAAESYGRAPVIADPWQSIGLLQRLKEKGLAAKEYPFTAASVGKLAQTLYTLLRDRNLGLPDDRELIDELAHVRLIEKSPGVFRMDHDRGRHDDRAVALALAAQHLLTVSVGGVSVGPTIWEAGSGGVGLDRWCPGHVPVDHPDWRNHLATAEASGGCDACRAEALERMEARHLPVLKPVERRGRFLLKRK